MPTACGWNSSLIQSRGDLAQRCRTVCPQFSKDPGEIPCLILSPDAVHHSTPAGSGRAAHQADDIKTRSMGDQLIDAARSHVLFPWIIQDDPLEHLGKFVARFATDHPTIYVMVADSLAAILFT